MHNQIMRIRRRPVLQRLHLMEPAQPPPAQSPPAQPTQPRQAQPRLLLPQPAQPRLLHLRSVPLPPVQSRLLPPSPGFPVDDHEIECPHCGGMLLIRASDINCTIFRHGVWKHTNEPIGPHTSKDECDRLVAENLIRGCGRPFTFDGSVVRICDYI